MQNGLVTEEVSKYLMVDWNDDK